jgi:hypothetical protein
MTTITTFNDVIDGYIDSKLNSVKETSVLRGRIMAYEVIEKTVVNELAQLRSRLERIENVRTN